MLGLAFACWLTRHWGTLCALAPAAPVRGGLNDLVDRVWRAWLDERLPTNASATLAVDVTRHVQRWAWRRFLVSPAAIPDVCGFYEIEALGEAMLAAAVARTGDEEASGDGERPFSLQGDGSVKVGHRMLTE